MSETKEFKTSCISPEGRASYPNLFKPRENDLSGKMEYSVELLFKKGEDLSKLQQACDNAMEKKFGPKAKWPKSYSTPFKKQDELIEKLKEKGKPTDHLTPGAYFIRLKSESPPQVVDQHKEEILEPSKVYGGCFLRCSMTAFAYNTGANKGVTLYLNNVQFLRDGDPFGSKRNAADDFEAVSFDDADDDLIG